MTKLLHADNADVQAQIEQAASQACKTLDTLFPGNDNGGITSNFQGLLVEALTHMLKGHSLLDAKRGHFTELPQLIVDETFFGNPLTRGDAFLVVQAWDAAKPETIVLDPDSNLFMPISKAGDAFTSFDAAAKQAFDYCVREGLDVEQATELGLQVRAVAVNQASQTGYILVSDLAATA